MIYEKAILCDNFHYLYHRWRLFSFGKCKLPAPGNENSDIIIPYNFGVDSMNWHELRIKDGRGFLALRLAIKFELSQRSVCAKVLYPGATRYVLLNKKTT